MVLELIDDHRPPDSTTDASSCPEETVPESFETFSTRELPRLIVLARALAGDLAAEYVAPGLEVAYRRWSRISTLGSPVGLVRGICAHQAAFVGLPGRGTGPVWSWVQGHDTAALDRNQALVDGISWPAH